MLVIIILGAMGLIAIGIGIILSKAFQSEIISTLVVVLGIFLVALCVTYVMIYICCANEVHYCNKIYGTEYTTEEYFWVGSLIKQSQLNSKDTKIQ